MSAAPTTTAAARARPVRLLVGLVLAAALCAGAAAIGGVFRASASAEQLPAVTPAALAAATARAPAVGFSGTVVSTLSLGLPLLSGFGAMGDESSLTSLLTGSHTLQVWYGGPDEQRVAMFGASDETDVFRDGRDVWQWSSSDRTATHLALPAASSALSPDALARGALNQLGSSARVRVVHRADVAHRPAYGLVVTPTSAHTLIGSVRIAVDGATKVPLGVQVFARGARRAAVDLAFTSIRFARPAERTFDFTPPPGAKVEQTGSGGLLARLGMPGAISGISVLGSGWAGVVAVRVPSALLHSGLLAPVLDQATAVSGRWGRGRLLRSALLDVLVVDDGRVFAGPVDPAALYAAAR